MLKSFKLYYFIYDMILNKKYLGKLSLLQEAYDSFYKLEHQCKLRYRTFMGAPRWWCGFKHWLESAQSELRAPLKFGTQVKWLVLKSTLIRRLGTGFKDL